MAHVAAVTAASSHPNYDTFTVRQEPQFASTPRPASPTVACNIESAIQSHHDRMQYYRQLSGQDDPAAEAASLQSEPERPQPTFWQSLWRCVRCRD
jgi:hypothetical protein